LITIQFDLNRKVDGAARDVQAAINAASSELPLNLPAPPAYRKVNPADAPILILAMTSDTDEPTRVFEYADEILGQRLSQVEGVSQVIINGAEKSAVRVQVNPSALASTGLSLEDVRTFLSQANVDSPKGSIDGEQASYAIYDNDQMRRADQYREWSGAEKRHPDLAALLREMLDGVENTRLASWSGTKPAVL
jgi:multidrug efflux pump subunit AcrB